MPPNDTVGALLGAVDKNDSERVLFTLAVGLRATGMVTEISEL